MGLVYHTPTSFEDKRKLARCTQRAAIGGAETLGSRESLKYVSHNLNFLKGGYIGDWIGDYSRGY